MKEENQKEKDAKKRAEAAAAAERSGLDADEEEYRSLRDRVDKSRLR